MSTTQKEVGNFLKALFTGYMQRWTPTDEATAKKLDEYLACCIKPKGLIQRGWTPQTIHQFFTEYEKNPNQACYVNTATLKMALAFDGKTKALRHKNEHIRELPIFMLDDIGTRTQPEELPPLLRKPTTIVESSPGNFQYAYRLSKPFTDIDEAREFITNLYSMGSWDGGGAVAAKFIRLPCGINGKMKDGQVITGKTDFRVRLVEINPEVEVDAEEVLKAVGFDPTTLAAKKCKLARSTARKAGQTFVSGDGIFDALMPWLEVRGQVFSGGDIWQTVICPWHEGHSEGNGIMAGYKPLGLGTGEDIYYRRFHCFHNHCKGKHIKDYLTKLEEDHEHFPEDIYAYDPAAKLLRDYIYVAKAPGFDSGCVVNIDTGQTHTVTGFRNLYAQKVCNKTMASHFMGSAIRPMADELRSRPDLTYTDGDLVFQVPDTKLTAFNDYRPLNFAKAEPDKAIIQPFLDHAKYLMPNQEEREYVLNWMAAKVQNPGFRGAVIMMVAPEHGTGRSTWWRMFGSLFPATHFSEISAQAFQAPWDDWMTNVLTICGEVTDKNDGADRWNLSELFKTRFDTSPSFLHLNIKCGRIVRNHMCCMSFVALTNHADAMRIDESDRRIYVVTNPMQPESADYFESLFAWERSDKPWRQHLWWWFKNRNLTGWNGYKPAPMTLGKRRMMKGSDGPVGAAVRAVMDAWNHRYIEPRQVRLALEQYQYDLMQHVHGQTRNKLDQQITAEIQRHAHLDGVYAQETIGGKRTDNRQRVDMGESKGQAKGTLLLRKGALLGQQDVPKSVDWKSVREAVDESLVPFGITGTPTSPKGLLKTEDLAANGTL